MIFFLRSAGTGRGSADGARPLGGGECCEGGGGCHAAGGGRDWTPLCLISALVDAD